jgi:hypothetical protein
MIIGDFSSFKSGVGSLFQRRPKKGVLLMNSESCFENMKS